MTYRLLVLTHHGITAPHQQLPALGLCKAEPVNSQLRMGGGLLGPSPSWLNYQPLHQEKGKVIVLNCVSTREPNRLHWTVSNPWT